MGLTRVHRQEVTPDGIERLALEVVAVRGDHVPKRGLAAERRVDRVLRVAQQLTAAL